MTESIVAIRMKRNLRYKLTYVKIFETYLESESRPEVTKLLRDLIQAQQAAISPLSSYLRRIEADSQDMDLDDKLLNHALSRENLPSRLRFIYDGLERATSWYQMQLVDKQMIADPELKELLFQLGETDAAKLWQVEAVMSILKIPVEVKKKDWDEFQRSQVKSTDQGWQSRLAEDVRRPSWSGERLPDWYRPGRSRGRDR